MGTSLYRMVIPAIIIFLITACGQGFQMGVGDRVIGVQSGKFFYTDGILKTEYSGAGFNEVWTAAEKTLEQFGAHDITREKNIATATLTGTVEGETVRIDIQYLSKDITLVAVRVGLSGDTLASKYIHEKIKENLINK